MGKCQVLKNEEGQLVNPHEGRFSNITVEPIEKRPLFHFLPGQRFLSVGMFGCSLSCFFCQNFTVSQSEPDGRGKYYDPSSLVELALQKGVSGIAFTYNEPTLYYEYIESIGREIQSLPLKLVLKSSGFVNEPILRSLCLCVDGFNIDLKGNEEDYQSVCGGSLEVVMKSIELISRMKIHLEISYLVLPDRLHDVDFHIGVRDWLAALSPDLPLHLLYFYPFYEMADTVPYPPEELERLHGLFSQKLNHVYISNRYDRLMSYRHTNCSVCGDVLISRNHPAKLIKHSCCNKRIAGVFS